MYRFIDWIRVLIHCRAGFKHQSQSVFCWYNSFNDFSSSISVWFLFSSTATRFSKHFMYSFFFLLHSRAASLFNILKIEIRIFFVAKGFHFFYVRVYRKIFYICTVWSANITLYVMSLFLSLTYSSATSALFFVPHLPLQPHDLYKLEHCKRLNFPNFYITFKILHVCFY